MFLGKIDTLCQFLSLRTTDEIFLRGKKKKTGKKLNISNSAETAGHCNNTRTNPKLLYQAARRSEHARLDWHCGQLPGPESMLLLTRSAVQKFEKLRLAFK